MTTKAPAVLIRLENVNQPRCSFAYSTEWVCGALRCVAINRRADWHCQTWYSCTWCSRTRCHLTWCPRTWWRRPPSSSAHQRTGGAGPPLLGAEHQFQMIILWLVIYLILICLFRNPLFHWASVDFNHVNFGESWLIWLQPPIDWRWNLISWRRVDGGAIMQNLGTLLGLTRFPNVQNEVVRFLQMQEMMSWWWKLSTKKTSERVWSN